MGERIVVDVQTTLDFAIVAESFFMARERLSQMAEPIADSANILREEIVRRFEEQDFAPLNDNTRKRFGARGDDFILVDSGAMYDAATSLAAWDLNTGGTTASAVLNKEFIGNAAPYYHFHITGTKYMPQRDFLSIDDIAAEERIDAVFEQFVARSLESVGV